MLLLLLLLLLALLTLTHLLLYPSASMQTAALQQFIRSCVATMSTSAAAPETAAVAGPIATRIREKLTLAFSPQHLDVLNESYMHNVPKGAETHFKARRVHCVIVCRSICLCLSVYLPVCLSMSERVLR